MVSRDKDGIDTTMFREFRTKLLQNHTVGDIENVIDFNGVSDAMEKLDAAGAINVAEVRSGEGVTDHDHTGDDCRGCTKVAEDDGVVVDREPYAGLKKLIWEGLQLTDYQSKWLEENGYIPEDVMNDRDNRLYVLDTVDLENQVDVKKIYLDTIE